MGVLARNVRSKLAIMGLRSRLLQTSCGDRATFSIELLPFLCTFRRPLWLLNPGSQLPAQNARFAANHWNTPRVTAKLEKCGG